MNLSRVTAAASLFLVLAACGSSSGSSSSDVPVKVQLRVAHLSPDAPAVDVCLRPRGTATLVGPVFQANGLPDGLAYGQVSRYLAVDAGAYDVRLVAASATDCATGLLPDFTSLPSLPEGAAVTVAAIGELAVGADHPFTLAPFVDVTTAPAGKFALRFVHASPNTPAVDVGVGSGEAFTALYTDVAFGEVDTGTGFTSGYLQADPLSGATISARATGTTADALIIPGVTTAAEKAYTAFAIGLLGDDSRPLKVLLCGDDPGAVGALSTCALVP